MPTFIVVAYIGSKEYWLTGYDATTRTMRWTPRHIIENGVSKFRKDPMKRRRGKLINLPHATTRYPNDDNRIEALVMNESEAQELARITQREGFGDAIEIMDMVHPLAS